LRSAVLGSVSRTLSTSAHCPVVIVPEGAAVGSGAGEPSIVCGTDGSDHALAATRLAGRLAERLGYRLIVVHALPDLKAVASYRAHARPRHRSAVNPMRAGGSPRRSSTGRPRPPPSTPSASSRRVGRGKR
jgi:nucleotide-binding universal stress UspA family protein